MAKLTEIKPLYLILIAIIILLLLVVSIYALLTARREAQEEIVDQATPPQENDSTVEVVVQDLDIPWDIEFLPSNEMLITQREGSLIRATEERREIIPVADVEATGEGGLLGIALHPNFSSNNYIYLYMTTQTATGLENIVYRYRLEENTLQDRALIIDGIPAGQNHNGGALQFGPDGKLYITTGDAGNSSNAQSLDSLGGKILRLNDNGSIPTDNPFNNSPIYSYGHRNVQGITWDNSGILWATEHGPSGAGSGFDEINRIEAGGNYGWPTIQGDETEQGFISPYIQSGLDETWAPAGIVYYREYIIFAGLRGQSLYKLTVENRSLERFFTNQYGRLRAIVLGPDGYLYISTSNLDGRGSPRDGDDRIIKVAPEAL